MIEKYHDKPWDWSCISANPNITIEMIEKYHDKSLNWEQISRNEFLYDKTVYIKSINNDIKNNKHIVYNILSRYINTYNINLICEFGYYN